MRVLIVEDEVDIHRYYSKALKRLGVEHDVVESKIEALSLLMNKSYEAAIVDLNLTDDQTFSHGKEVLARANEVGQGIICYVVSGTSKIEDALDAWDLGAVRFIPKSREDNQEVARIVAEAAASNDLDYFGKFQRLETYLASPDFGSDWESIISGKIGTQFRNFKRSLSDAFDPILPILRLDSSAPAFEVDSNSKCISGAFWSKGIGCAVQVEISSKPIEKENVDPDSHVKDGVIGNDAHFRVFKLPDLPRDRFVEKLQDTPWITK